MRNSFFLFTLAALISCNQKSESYQKSESTRIEDSLSIEKYNEEQSKIKAPKLDKTFTVYAEVFRIINNFDGTSTLKDANRKEYIYINSYTSGSMYLDGYGMVSLSIIPGYEFECGHGNVIYAFNVQDMKVDDRKYYNNY